MFVRLAEGPWWVPSQRFPPPSRSPSAGRRRAFAAGRLRVVRLAEGRPRFASPKVPVPSRQPRVSPAARARQVIDPQRAMTPHTRPSSQQATAVSTAITVSTYDRRLEIRPPSRHTTAVSTYDRRLDIRPPSRHTTAVSTYDRRLDIRHRRLDIRPPSRHTTAVSTYDRRLDIRPPSRHTTAVSTRDRPSNHFDLIAPFAHFILI